MFREWVKGVGNLVISQLPESRLLYRVCSRYVDRCNGENNCDLRANGELRLLKEKLPSCRTVFDVGANVGEWAALALSVNPTIDLHCFEPSRFTFSHLESNHFPPNVRLNNIALGSAKGETELFLFGDGAGTNSLYPREGLTEHGIAGPIGRETVRLDTLDSYCDKHELREIDFLKLDVEGHELETLKGARAMLAHRRLKIIQFEFGGANIDARVFLMDIWKLFENLDYTFFKLFPDRIHPILSYSQTLERFQYQNWAIVRNDGA